MQIKQLANGVEGCFIKSSKFKTSRISINMFVKADEESVSAYSLLSMLLTSSTVDYPDYTSLNAALNELYGAALFGDVVKFGDMRMLRFGISVLDDKFTLNGEKVSKKAAELLLSAIFNPPIVDGKFKKDDFDSNKRILIEQIKGELNEKRLYAISKTESAMYEGEPAGVSRYGSVVCAEALTNEQVVAAHAKLLKEAFVRVNVISQSEPDMIFKKIAESFSSLNRDVEKNNITKVHKQTGEIKNIEEHMNVTQGKLCLGFSLDTGCSRQDVAKAAVFVDIFGGGPYSKLFLNVREKQSLCYYCAARFDSKKGSFIVDSGILEENREKAYQGILQQLEDIKAGNVTDDELNSSKMALTDYLITVNDLAANIDSWYALATFNNGETIEDYSKLIKNVTLNDVINVANSVKLDTVYFLGSDKEEK